MTIHNKQSFLRLGSAILFAGSMFCGCGEDSTSAVQVDQPLVSTEEPESSSSEMIVVSSSSSDSVIASSSSEDNALSSSVELNFSSSETGSGKVYYLELDTINVSSVNDIYFKIKDTNYYIEYTSTHL